jgi:hypothetical protein
MLVAYRLAGYLHAGEGRDGVAWRWTTGELVLNPDFWGGLTGHVALHVTCNNNNATRRRIAPVKARVEVRFDSATGCQTWLGSKRRLIEPAL